jgi:hypothetical protein
MVAALSLKEKNQDVINQAIAQLQQGRDNASGTVTLTANSGSTTVAAPTCSPSSSVFLQELTADAAAARFTAPYVLPVAQKGQFVLNHANNTQNDRTFFYRISGGN